MINRQQEINDLAVAIGIDVWRLLLESNSPEPVVQTLSPRSSPAA